MHHKPSLTFSYSGKCSAFNACTENNPNHFAAICFAKESCAKPLPILCFDAMIAIRIQWYFYEHLLHDLQSGEIDLLSSESHGHIAFTAQFPGV